MTSLEVAGVYVAVNMLLLIYAAVGQSLGRDRWQ